MVYQTYCHTCQEKFEYDMGKEACTVTVNQSEKEKRNRNVRNENSKFKGRPNQGENYHVKYIDETGRRL